MHSNQGYEGTMGRSRDRPAVGEHGEKTKCDNRGHAQPEGIKAQAGGTGKPYTSNEKRR